MKRPVILILSLLIWGCSSHKSEFGQNFNPGQCQTAASELFESELVQFSQKRNCKKARIQGRQMRRVAHCFELSNDYDQLITARSYMRRMTRHQVYLDCLDSDEIGELKEHLSRLDTILKENSNEELIRAVWQGDRTKVSLLLEGLADVNYKTPNGFTALIFSIRHNKNQISELLLKKGANPRAKTKGGLTALDYARASGNAQLQKKISRALKQSL